MQKQNLDEFLVRVTTPVRDFAIFIPEGKIPGDINQIQGPGIWIDPERNQKERVRFLKKEEITKILSRISGEVRISTFGPADKTTELYRVAQKRFSA